MNHFDYDTTTRRLDALALSAIQRLAPANLFDGVTADRIGRCGILPAVIVIETFRLVGGLTAVEGIGYAGAVLGRLQRTLVLMRGRMESSALPSPAISSPSPPQ